MIKKLKNDSMILKTATFLYKTISAYWYTINQGIQIHGKWFN